MSVQEKFLTYVSYDTQSDETTGTRPSTPKQKRLGRLLEAQLQALGCQDVHMDPNGIVYGFLEATDPSKEAIGLIAHMDTAGSMSGKDVRPRIIEEYDGGLIELNEEYSMDPERFPALNRVIGDDIIVTDGTTLLGNDDKGGVAIIMQTVEEMAHNPKQRGRVYVAFTTDEEIGMGADGFDLDFFTPEFAYTIDGEAIDYVDYETFNGAHAEVNIHGKSIHPGSAKDKMKNAAAIAVHYASLLPEWMVPEHTENREGFIHLMSITGDGEFAKLNYILRDHDYSRLHEKKTLMESAAAFINKLYGNVCRVEIQDQYRNMKDYMHGDFRSVQRAQEGLRSLGIEPKSSAIRGGTDGSVLTERGLNCPNLGTGGGNLHGRFEFASINKMETMVKLLHHIIEGNEED